MKSKKLYEKHYKLKKKKKKKARSPSYKTTFLVLGDVNIHLLETNWAGLLY